MYNIYIVFYIPSIIPSKYIKVIHVYKEKVIQIIQRKRNLQSMWEIFHKIHKQLKTLSGILLYTLILYKIYSIFYNNTSISK
jgi:hypothetical protein